MPFVGAVLIVFLLIAAGVALQWLPYGASGLRVFRSRYSFAYVVLLVEERPEFGFSLREAARRLEPDAVLDSFYVVGAPALHPWFAKRDAREYFRDSDDFEEPPYRGQTDVRLLVYAGSVLDFRPEPEATALGLLRQIAELPDGKGSLHLLKWLPGLDAPAMARQDGADWFARLLARTI